ncbi:MAG: undecaprenyl-diphosphate phosphatase [Chitinophagia bacterium]|nr:undecaprenyl-diphosphate phosphatase [Chitinophagia bacterium]
MTWIENLILSVVEGLTEFLPVSSTGHLMMTREMLGMGPSEHETYLIAIQFGAIASVLTLYWKRFFSKDALWIYPVLIMGFIPAAVLGFLFDDLLEMMLQAPWIPGLTLVIFGFVLLYIEKIFPPGEKKISDLSFLDAIKIGLFQCLAMIPGVSRSAATIAGGLNGKLTRAEATEFSFLLALPTLSAAGGYKLLKHWDELKQGDELMNIGIGNVISFITAYFAVKYFIGYIQKKGFGFFGYYRIAVGSLFLVYWLILK